MTLVIAWRTTKLIEGGHRGLQAYRPICYYFYVFTFFTFFFKIQKNATLAFFLPCFIRFLELWLSWCSLFSFISLPKLIVIQWRGDSVEPDMRLWSLAISKARRKEAYINSYKIHDTKYTDFLCLQFPFTHYCFTKSTFISTTYSANSHSTMQQQKHLF